MKTTTRKCAISQYSHPRTCSSSGSSKSLTEDQLFAEIAGVKLAKISEGEDKEDIKLDILTSLSNLLKKQKRENNN